MKKKLRKFFRKNKKRKIIIIVMVVLLLILIGIYGSIVWKFYSGIVDTVPADQVDSTAENVMIAETEKKDDEVVNILLVGTDTRDPNSDMGRSDSMMMISFNKTEQKTTAVSFLRDSLVEIDGHGKSRLGHTYAYGGVGLTINTINQTYDLDIQDYITINFENLVSVIDEIGGVTVYISEEEAEYYKKNGMPDIYAGEVTLTGSQALAHARNRTLGSDFERTRRQRSVIYGIYRKVMEEKDPTTLLPLINYCMGQVKTNMEVGEIYELAKEVLAIDNLELQSASLPTEGTYKSVNYEGMAVLELDLEANKEYLNSLLY
ncbi:MAG: LCP family protein [Dorea sp.]